MKSQYLGEGGVKMDWMQMISQAEVEIAARLPIKQNINTGKTICQRTQKNGGGFFCPTDKLKVSIRIFLVTA